MSSEAPAPPHRISRKSWLGLAAIVLVGLVMYLWVVIVYNTEGGYATNVDQSGTDGLTYAVAVEISPTAFDSQTNTAALHLRFQASGEDGLLSSTGEELAKNVRFTIDGSSGSQEFRFPAGTRLADKDITLTTQGPSWEYPFDVHTGSIGMSADTYTKQSDGTLVTDQPLSLGVIVDEQAQADGGVTGWDTVIEAATFPVYSNFDLTYTRGFSTKVFALMLLVLAVLLAMSTAVVAFLVAAEQRRAEIGLMAWTASLLFALPALRSFMPNSPPIGAQIDMYVYLWVMAAAILAAITVIISWVRQSRHRASVDPTAGAGGMARIPDAPSADMSGD
jgi:Domain of unknown function (DUF4436)